MQPNAEVESPVSAPFKASPAFRWTLERDQGWPLATDARHPGCRLCTWSGEATPQETWTPTICAPFFNTLNPCFHMFTLFSKFCWPCPFQQLPPNAVSAAYVVWRPTFKRSYHDRNKTAIQHDFQIKINIQEFVRSRTFHQFLVRSKLLTLPAADESCLDRAAWVQVIIMHCCYITVKMTLGI